MNITQELAAIKARNARVEADKAWELSWTRAIIISILTYIIIVVSFVITNLPDPYFNALISTVLFILSTSSYPFFKRIWLKHHNKKKS